MAAISKVGPQDDDITRKQAIDAMKKLYRINQRWNLPQISEFIRQKQKELMGW